MSVVSFPLLLDRHVGVAAAIITSFRIILRNPLRHALWGIFVAGLQVVGSLPFLLGLAVVMPMLGPRDLAPLPQARRAGSRDRRRIPPHPKARRSAADFPFALFMPTKPPDPE